MEDTTSLNSSGWDFRRCNFSAVSFPNLQVGRLRNSPEVGTFWGPSTGVCSVMWFGLRTDSSFPLWFEWGVFAIWTISYLVYIDQQAKSVRPHRENTFVLAVFVVTIVFIALIAVTFRQQARHVFTSLPLCLAFSTFGVSYVFGLRGQKLETARREEEGEAGPLSVNRQS